MLGTRNSRKGNPWCRQNRLGVLLGTLCTVLGASATAVLDTDGVEGAAYNMIANARNILYSSAPNEND